MACSSDARDCSESLAMSRRLITYKRTAGKSDCMRALQHSGGVLQLRLGLFRFDATRFLGEIPLVVPFTYLATLSTVRAISLQMHGILDTPCLKMLAV